MTSAIASPDDPGTEWEGIATTEGEVVIDEDREPPEPVPGDARADAAYDHWSAWELKRELKRR